MGRSGGRSAAVFLLAFLVATTAAFLIGGKSSHAQEKTVSAAEDLEAAKNACLEFRAGNDAVLPKWRDLAKRCAQDHHRPDAQRLFDYYSVLPREARVRGMEQEARVESVRQEAKKAGDAIMSPLEWGPERERLLRELHQIVEDNRSAADAAPAARALALRSTLFRQRVITDDKIEELEFREWITVGESEAQLSLELFDRVGMELPKLEPLLNMGWFAQAKPELDAAEQQFETVYARAHASTNTQIRIKYELEALDGLLAVAQDSGDRQRTFRLLNELRKLGSEKLSWNVVEQYAQFLLDLDEPRLADEFLVQHKPHADKELGEWQLLMMGVTGREGLTEVAALYATVVRKSSRAKVPGSPESLALADMDCRAGMSADVLDRLDGLDISLMPISRKAHLARIRGAAMLELHHYAEAAAVLRGALELSESCEGRHQGIQDSNSTASLVGETVGLESLAMLARAQIEVGDCMQAAADIENWQSRRLRREASQDPSAEIEVADVKGWAAAYECGLITWVVGADTTVVVHVNPNGHAVASWSPHGRKDIQNAIRRLRDAALTDNLDSTSRIARGIQEILLPDDVTRHLNACFPGRVLLCLHGALENLPVDLLPIFAGSSSSSPIPVVLPGLLVRAPGSAFKTSDDQAWSILGDPVESTGEDSVPQASSELLAVGAEHAGSRVCSGADFTRAELLKALRQGHFLHLASHLVAATWDGSSIDGTLNHATIVLSHGDRFSIDDIRSARPHHELAVVNACFTGGGEFVDGEAAQGLANAFLSSGTRNLLVSMWPITDQAATRYAVAFHRGLASGLDPARSASSARNELRDSGAPPADWAAFRLVGRD